jgi:hypothetical protein
MLYGWYLGRFLIAVPLAGLGLLLGAGQVSAEEKPKPPPSPAKPPSPKGDSNPANRIQLKAAEIDALRKAYDLLVEADAYYDGHRKHAMDHIQRAVETLEGCKDLLIRWQKEQRKRKSAVYESLARSDAQLRQAAAVAADPAPAIGTWELSAPLGGGRDFKATVAFVRQDADRVYGVIEWQPDGPQKTLELFVAHPDGEGVWRLVGREEHTRVADIFPSVYRGTLGDNGRTLSGFSSISEASTGISGGLRWVKAVTPTYPPTVTASLILTGERPLLYEQLSANYALDGVRVHHGPDRHLLGQLAGSRDKKVAGLAELKTLLQDLHEQAMAKDARELAEWAKGDLERRAKLVKFFAEAIRSDDGEGNTGQAVVDLLNSLGFEKAFDRQRSSVELACVKMVAITHIRAEIRRDYVARNPKRPAMPTANFVVGFKVNPGGRVAVTLRNNTGGDLHNVALGTRMAVDQKRVDKYEKDTAQKERMYGALAVGLGIDPRTVGSALRLEDVLCKYFRLEKGVPAFVPLWPKRTTLEVEVGMTGDLSLIAASAGAWIGSDEGMADLSFDLDAIRRVIRAMPGKKELPKKGP